MSRPVLPQGWRERGRRLAKEHQLPLGLGVMVARGVLNVEQARKRAKRRAREKEEESAASTGRQMKRSVVLTGGLLLGVVMGVLVIPDQQAMVPVKLHSAVLPGRVAAAAAAPDREPGALSREQLEKAVARNAEGRLSQVAGRSPVDVLQTYCQSAHLLCVPEGIASSKPPQAGMRLGVFSRQGARHAIRIRRDRQRGGWVAGGGSTTVPTVPAGGKPEIFIAGQGR